MVARLAEANIQWWVLLAVGTFGFVNELRSTKNVAVLTTCAGLMSTPAVFARRKEPAP